MAIPRFARFALQAFRGSDSLLAKALVGLKIPAEAMNKRPHWWLLRQ